MPDDRSSAAAVDRERQMLLDAEGRGGGAKVKTWFKLSGPGWLQSAITLGGGSLGGSLYLGMLAGTKLLWVQIMAMAFGVIMLGAIGYVTLSTGQRPFGLINQKINPVLGWGWALATLMANVVWCMPQFSLANAAVQQNLIPGLGGTGGKVGICIVLLVVSVMITMMYDRGGKGLKAYETLLRVLVAVIVICFFSVVVKLALSGGVSFGEVFGGLVPDFSLWNSPAPTLQAALSKLGHSHQYWSDTIVAMQKDVMITVAATAVGINMTFLLPYSLLKKGWDRHFRGLQLFDLATGMAIPFVLATGCVVIASANRFHGVPAGGLVDGPEINAKTGKVEPPPPAMLKQYEGYLAGLLKLRGVDVGALPEQERKARLQAMPRGDREMAATLVKRDNFQLANALKPLTGEFVASYIFGFGVLAMALSTITILMLISGFTFCEIFGFQQGGLYHKIGCLLPVVGVLGPFIWSDVAAWAVVPTSVFGMTLLPIAYFTFFFLMNSKSVLGDDLPTGGKTHRLERADGNRMRARDDRSQVGDRQQARAEVAGVARSVCRILGVRRVHRARGRGSRDAQAARDLIYLRKRFAV